MKPDASGSRRRKMQTRASACTSIWPHKKEPKKKLRKPNRKPEATMVELGTTYLGLQLRTPLVASASPLSHEIDSIQRLEDAGASAVVLYSLFEEQLRQEEIELERGLDHGTE